MMWLPVALGPVGAAAGVAGFFSRRMAKTALPIASAAIVANGLQGTYLHARGIAQKPGGWRTPATTWRWDRRCWRRCWSPWSAGWACSPRSCGGRSDAVPAPTSGGIRPRPPVPRLRRARQAGHWDPVTAGVVLVPARTAARHPRSSPPPSRPCATALCDQLLGQQDDPRDPRRCTMIDARLAEQQTDGWRYDDMPEDGQAWRDTLAALDADAGQRCGDRVRGRARRAAGGADPGRAGPGTERLARPERRRTCGACGPATPARRFYSHPLGLERDRLPRARPTPAATRTPGSTSSSRSRSATPGRADDPIREAA